MTVGSYSRRSSLLKTINMSLFNNSEKPIGLASDHAGYKAKRFIIKILEERGIPYKDFGAYSEERSDYHDFAHLLA